MRAVGGAILACLLTCSAGSAQVASLTTADPAASPAGPAAPAVATPVISRDPSGQTTIRATRVAEPLRIDGRLDERIYTDLPAITDFIQNEPYEGTIATEKTELWIVFDAQYVYVSARCWESEPNRTVASEMRRDGANFWTNDHLALVFDTFHDRRNSLEFAVNPIGGRAEGQVTNERLPNGDWNPVWNFAVSRFEHGWTAEMAIPFFSLRYRPGVAQVWGFNARRTSRWKNENSHITRLPNALGTRAIFQVSQAATLLGLEAPPLSKQLEIAPFVTSSVTSDNMARPVLSRKLAGDFGVNAKYGITRNLTLDLTYNTDFAQVEADEQQINLTRFSLFFPEKREFFLENQGTFSFGGAVTAGATVAASDTPILFYSRRIGLSGGRAVPLQAGGRLTGRVGRYTIGALNIQSSTDAAVSSQAENFSTVRVRRDFLRRSNFGMILTNRTPLDGAPANTVVGADGTFAFFNNLAFNTYAARSATTGRSGDDNSYRAQLDYAGDRYAIQAERLVVGKNFDPGIGFLRRSDFRRSSGLMRFSPRLLSSRTVRKLIFQGSLAYVEDGQGRPQTRIGEGLFETEFHTGDRFALAYTENFEFLVRPFQPVSTLSIPAGGYTFGVGRVGYFFGTQRRLAASVGLEHGDFYGGTRTALTVSRGLISIRPQLSVEPTVVINHIEHPTGVSTTQLLGTRATYTRSARMFVSALVQYNSNTHSLATNARLRWEYQPGSELFLVYNDQRGTLDSPTAQPSNRALIFKITRLFRF